VGIKQRECKHFRIELEFAGDDFKWWSIGYLPALDWFYGVAWHAACLRQALAGIRVGRKRRL
jgi:hypothetical protein